MCDCKMAMMTVANPVVSHLALRKATQPSLNACFSRCIQLHVSESALEGSESGTGASRVANVLEYVLNGGFTVADIILRALAAKELF